MAWNWDLHSIPIFQARIFAWFKSPSFSGVTDFTKILPGTEHQIPLLRLQLISSLLPDKVLKIFLYKPVYDHDGFRMWDRIFEKYEPRGNNTLFESL